MAESKYKAIVNSNHVFEFDDSQLELSDMATLEGNAYHIITEDHTSKVAEVVNFNKQKKLVTVEIDGEQYDVVIKDAFDILVKEMGLSANVVKKVSAINAPMPGLVIEVLVENGQTVAEGENLLILEAMKMENIIKAPADIAIKEIKVKKGDAVEKNQILIDLIS